MGRRVKKPSVISGVNPNVTCNFFSGEDWRRETTTVPREKPLTIFINGQETTTILCTPTLLTQLVLGFLYGSVTSSKTQAPRVDSELVVTPQEILSLMKQLHHGQNLFQQSGGIHCSALCNREQILVLAEDIGRHNTLDKIIGECLIKKLPTQDHLLLTTGRISSEMLLKAAMMQSPIIVSRGSPTDHAISLGNDLGITIIGYARNSRLSVFSTEERLYLPKT